MRIRSSNPIYRTRNIQEAYVSDRPITYAGVAIRTILLLVVAAGSAMYAIFQLESFSMGWLFGAMILGFISVIIGTRNTRLAPYFGILYAICEGYVLGIVSLLFASQYEGIIPTALTTTAIVLLVMMLLYSMNIIKVNQRFASFLVVAMITVILMGLISLFVPFNGPFYFLICIVTTLIACFYLFLDFENIKNAVEGSADASLGWVLALGLMVSIVWVYIEILRLLVIFGNRRN